jgi:glycosyltransferase involved in cell wall biosynthesis
MKIFCVIPAYNEEKNIFQVVREVIDLVDVVVVVDDCSTDKTALLAKEAGAVVLHHSVNRFQGAALQTGNDYAIMNGADIIVHFDADGQFLANEIKSLTEPISSGEYDMVFGSRFLEKKSDLPFVKDKIIMPIARMVNYLFFGINFTDPQSGFRAMSRAAAETIQIEQDGMSHCSEILHKAFAKKLRIKEVPITVIYEEFGQGFGGGFKIIKEFILNKLVR